VNSPQRVQLSLHDVNNVECKTHNYAGDNAFTVNTLTVSRDAAEPVSIVLFGAPGLRIRVTVEQEPQP
jgi:hypothetical protein